MEIGTQLDKTPWKARLIHGGITGIGYIIFIIISDYYRQEDEVFWKYIVQFLAFTIIFILIMPPLFKFFYKFSLKKINKISSPEYSEGEELEYHGPSSLISGRKIIPGKIFLSNHRFNFVPLKDKYSNAQLNIPYESIKNVKASPAKWYVTNRIEVHHSDSSISELIVNERELWIGKIKEKLS